MVGVQKTRNFFGPDKSINLTIRNFNTPISPPEEFIFFFLSPDVIREITSPAGISRFYSKGLLYYNKAGRLSFGITFVASVL